MLRSFRLANHRSFRDEHELLLLPSYGNDRDVVPVAAVFGANASRKSSLLDGLRLMSDLVRSWSTREPGSGILRSPFRLEPKSLLEPSSFAVELVLDGVRYTYGFAVDDERVIREWLHAYPRNRRRVLFARDGASIDFGSTVTQRTRAEVIKDLLTDDTLFLAVAARLKLDQYQPVVDWFLRSLLFVWPSHASMHRDERLAWFVERSEPDRVRFLDLARAADVGISGIAVECMGDPRAFAEAEMLDTMAEKGFCSPPMTRSCSRRPPVNRAWTETRCGSPKSIRTGRPSSTRSRTSSHELSTILPGVIWVVRMEPFRSLMGSTCSVLLSQLTSSESCGSPSREAPHLLTADAATADRPSSRISARSVQPDGDTDMASSTSAIPWFPTC